MKSGYNICWTRIGPSDRKTRVHKVEESLENGLTTKTFLVISGPVGPK
jgi:hypothetical protein